MFCISITESAKLGYLNCLSQILPEIIVWKTCFVFLFASTITCGNSFFLAFLITVKLLLQPPHALITQVLLVFYMDFR